MMPMHRHFVGSLKRCRTGAKGQPGRFLPQPKVQDAPEPTVAEQLDTAQSAAQAPPPATVLAGMPPPGAILAEQVDVPLRYAGLGLVDLQARTRVRVPTRNY